MPDFNSMPEINVCLLVFSVLVTLFLLIGTAADRARNRPFMKSFICLLITHVIVQIGETGIWFFDGSPEKAGVIRLCCVLSFGVGTVMVGLIMYCLLEFFREREYVSMLPAHIMAFFCAVQLVLILISVWNGMIFMVDEQGHFVDGPYALEVNVFDAVAFLIDMGVIIYYRRFLSVRGLLSLLSYCALPISTMLLVDIWYPVPLYLATTLSLIVIFLFFHGELTRQLAEREKELSKSRLAILVSQILPHFLYNSLNSIYHLCDKDVNLAKQALNDFSEYLHHILGSVKRTTPIPFEEELQFVKNYLELEKMRFDDDLNVIYRIEATDFLVPALSVQPLVENAVKHGICGKDDGGTLILSAKEYADCFEVTVTDDGVGFDPQQEPDDGKLHVGINNTKQRLYAVCEGTLTVESKPGEGTTATIRLPKENKHEDTCRR